jgi:hypothetical protein
MSRTSLVAESAVQTLGKTPWKCGPPGSLSSTLAGGFVAGVASAVVLIFSRIALYVGGATLLARLLPWHAPANEYVPKVLWGSVKLAAYPFVGDRVYESGFDAPVVWIAVATLLLYSIGMGVLFALIVRGRSLKATCAVAIPFGFGAWAVGTLLLHSSPATVIEALPSGLAMAFVFLWFERRLSFRIRQRPLKPA